MTEYRTELQPSKNETQAPLSKEAVKPVWVGISFPWSMRTDQIVDLYKTSSERGLSPTEVIRRQKIVGLNQIIARQPVSWVQVFFRQFKSLLVALLAIAAIVSLVAGDVVDGLAIFWF